MYQTPSIFSFKNVIEINDFFLNEITLAVPEDERNYPGEQQINLL